MGLRRYLTLGAIWLVLGASALVWPTSSQGQDGAAAKELPSDAQIKKRLAQLSDDDLENFYQVYYRLNNGDLSSAILAEARRRSPALAARLEDAVKMGSADPFRRKMDQLVKSKAYSEAIAQMEGLRSTQYQDQDFPYDRLLADSYTANGQKASALTVWKRILTSGRASEDDKAAAQLELAQIAREEDLLAAYRLLERKKFDEATEAAEEGLRRYPGNADYLKLKQEIVLARQVEGAYELMRKGRRGDALTRSEELLERYPKELEIKVLHAEALAFAWRFDEALPLLEDLKAKHFSKRLFPGEGALGDCYAAKGDFVRAIASHRLAASDPKAAPSIVQGERRTIRELEQKLKSFSGNDAEFRDETEGTAGLFQTEYSHFLSSRTRVGFQGYARQVSLNEDLLVESGENELWGAQAFVRQRINQRGFVEGRLGGGSFGRVSGAVSFGREQHQSNQPADKLELALNRLSTDSLQPIFLDAVQDSISYTGIRQLDLLTQGTFWASLRSVDVDEADLGNGHAMSLEVRRTLWENSLETSGAYLAYRGYHQRFAGETFSPGSLRALGMNPALGNNPGENFFESSFDSHGFALMGQYEVDRDLYLYGSGAALYEFGEEEMIYQLEAGINWEASPMMDLDAGVFSSSNGIGAANQGSSSALWRLGLRIYF